MPPSECIRPLYNRLRRHSALDYLSPAEYEAMTKATYTAAHGNVGRSVDQFFSFQRHRFQFQEPTG
jgi:hypothetical protein